MYLIHGIMAIFAMSFAIFHDQMSHIHGMSGLFGNIALYESIAIIGLALIFLSSQILTVIPGMNSLINFVRKMFTKLKIDRELNLLFHAFAPLIVVFVFLHVCLISEFSNNFPFIFFFGGYFVIFAIFYLYYGVYKKLAVPTYSVESLTMMNDNTFKLVLRFSKGKHLTIKSGQFVFIHPQFAKIDEYHPFYVAKSENNSEIITLGIKEAGDFTKHLESLKPGSSVKIKGVFGHFSIPNNDYPVLAIAGGIGITPCLGLAEEISNDKEFYLIWSVRANDEVVFRNEIEQLLQTHPNIKIIIQNTSKDGRLNKNILIRDVPELTNKSKINCFLCGPAPMMKSIENILIEQDVPKDFILSEGFIF